MSESAISNANANIESEDQSVTATPQPELLPLDSPERIAVFQYKGKTRRHIFRRFTAADWENFHAHVMAEFKTEKGGITRTVGMDYALLVLYARTVRKAEGYLTEDGREPEKLPDWPECIPQHHRLEAMKLITNMSYTDADEDSILRIGGVSVTVDAMWNEKAPGEMKQYLGLVHHFAYPSVEHHRRLLRAQSSAFVARGSRSGTTVIPSGHGILVSLYDDLIRSVDGYGIGGRALSSKDEIVGNMDAFHKSAVVAQLFQTPAGNDEENTEAK